MATHAAVRRWIMTGAVTGITVTGTIYGAGLKEDQQIKQKKKKILQATPEEKIAQLESAREHLVMKKNEMERKIAAFKERRRAEEQAKEEGK